MRTIQASEIGKAVEALCLEVSTELPPDVLEALGSFREEEKSGPARQVIDLIIENARVASEAGVPLCQDTGMFTAYVTLGRDTAIEGDLQAEASAAVARATARGYLRASVVECPMDERRNTTDNTPALVEIDLSEADDRTTTVAVLAKGGGSEMASRAAMLAPGAGWDGVLDFVLGVVSEQGARACPPLVLGVGVGGAFDSVAVMAKRALLEPLDQANDDAKTAARESELVAAVNGLGIGPGAIGGTTTCFGAKIRTAPCHMASLPVALSVNCHSLRRKVIEI
jgi:fumarate hydratase subunit alpha